MFDWVCKLNSQMVRAITLAAILAILGGCTGSGMGLNAQSPYVTNSNGRGDYKSDMSCNGSCGLPPPGGAPGSGTPGGPGSGNPVNCFSKGVAMHVEATRGGTTRDCGGGGGGADPHPTSTPATVASVSPSPGLTCDQSPGALGTSNMSPTSGPVQTGAQSTVTDIFGLKNVPSTNTAYAWVYTTGSGNIFIQYNPNVGGSAVASWIGHVVGGAPFAGPALTATIQSLVNTAANPTQITSQEWSDIQQSITYSNNSSGGRGPVVHECFTAPLTVAWLGELHTS